MKKNEEVTAKVKELTAAIEAAGGSVMIVGNIPSEDENKGMVAAALHGKSSDISEGFARLLMNENAATFQRIINNAQIITLVVAMRGVSGCDKCEVEENKM